MKYVKRRLLEVRKEKTRSEKVPLRAVDYCDCEKRERERERERERDREREGFMDVRPIKPAGPVRPVRPVRPVGPARPVSPVGPVRPVVSRLGTRPLMSPTAGAAPSQIKLVDFVRLFVKRLLPGKLTKVFVEVQRQQISDVSICLVPFPPLAVVHLIKKRVHPGRAS